ncbi:hypothetical protein GCM10029992_51930 [Glycomyces albus]
MTDSTRAYFDTLFNLAGDSGQRARDLAGKLREDLRSGVGQIRSQGSRTVTDVGRLIRHEVDAGFTRLGLATQADVEDANLRLEHLEQELQELRVRLADAERRATTPPAQVTSGPNNADTDHEERE